MEKKKAKYSNLYGVDIGRVLMVMEKKEFFTYKKALKKEKIKNKKIEVNKK